MTISKVSRWNRAMQLKVYDAADTLVRRPYLTAIKPPRRTTYPDNREYSLKVGDTWSNLAFRFLGDSRLWWTVCEWNQVVNPWQELEDGIANNRKINIPSVNRVHFDVVAFGVPVAR